MKNDWGEYILKLYDSNGLLIKEQDPLNFISGKEQALEWEKEADGNVAVLLRVLYTTNERKRWDVKNS